MLAAMNPGKRKPAPRPPHGCPIRYSVGALGDRWTLLIVRDLMFYGRRRYGEFLTAGEGIATNILADRLARLEGDGIVAKARDPANQTRNVYTLTEKGRDLLPVLLAMIDWAEKYDSKTEVPGPYARRLRRDREQLSATVLKEIDEKDHEVLNPVPDS
jgi:DNA-binding HxlR family transcriptional regulator